MMKIVYLTNWNLFWQKNLNWVRLSLNFQFWVEICIPFWILKLGLFSLSPLANLGMEICIQGYELWWVQCQKLQMEVERNVFTNTSCLVVTLSLRPSLHCPSAAKFQLKSFPCQSHQCHQCHQCHNYSWKQVGWWNWPVSPMSTIHVTNQSLQLPWCNLRSKKQIPENYIHQNSQWESPSLHLSHLLDTHTCTL